MKDALNIHLKVQELCDCFATNDPLKEMSILQHDTDTDEAALKWIALAVLHGINNNADTVSISTAKGGKIRVTAEYRTAELPPPAPETAKRIIDAIRSITHIEKDREKSAIAFGVRNTSMDLKIDSRHEGEDDKITITFP